MTSRDRVSAICVAGGVVGSSAGAWLVAGPGVALLLFGALVLLFGVWIGVT